MTKPVDTRILKLQEQLKQAKSLKQKIESRERAALGKKTKSLDDKRKILLGACMMKMMQDDPQTNERMLRRMDAFLTRPSDRELFNFTTATEPASAQS